MKTNKEFFEYVKNELTPNLRNVLEMFFKYAPKANLIDFKREDKENWIVLYENKENECTPYIIHHMNKSGLYWGHYETDFTAACIDFDKLTYNL